MKKDIESRLFLFFVSMCPLIDLVNGYFMESRINVPVGVIYRVMLILLLLIFILKSGIQQQFISWFVTFFLVGNSLLLVLQSLILAVPITWLYEDFISLSKYFLWPLVFFYIYQNRAKFFLHDLQQTFLVISSNFTLGMLIPYMFGLGTTTYALEGYKSFFYAQNDLSIAFIICITFVESALLKRTLHKWDVGTFSLLLLFSGNILSMLLIGTKTTIGYSLICVLYFIWHLMGKSNKNNLLLKIVIGIVCAIFTLWFCLWGWEIVLNLISGSINRLSYFYKKYNGDWIRLLSSSRFLFLQGSFTAFFNESYFLFTFFIGQGFSYRLSEYGRMGLIEMDFFDLWFSLGIIGFMLFVQFVGFFLWQLIKKQNEGLYTYLFFIVLLFSFFVGHVFFSGLSSMLFGLICGGIFLKGKDSKL